MPTGSLRLILLWHMHQPFYKDLVTGEYRLPWVRMHALKDYYGMVKLTEEFPDVHMTFNLVPSLIAQIQDYASGSFRDPFFDVVSKPAADLTPDERRFALIYLFQAHPDRMIGRYPRYRALFEKVRAVGPDATRAETIFNARDYADLQVLSQIAWFDEFFLDDPDVKALIDKREGFNAEDQRIMLRKQHKIMNAVLPAYREAAKRGLIELSTTPYYHPILPLVCDTNIAQESVPGLPLPRMRFRHPEDAEEQISRALDCMRETMSAKPKGMWPSEGSVSEEAISIAAENGIEWMATDEGVLARSLNTAFTRNDQALLDRSSAEELYNIYHYESAEVEMKMVFRDHRLSDLVGFVYAGMPAKDAAEHLVGNIKSQAAPVLASGRDAVVSIILDGENAWETFEKSGREFLRRFYSAVQEDKQIEAVTVSEAIARHKPSSFGRLTKVVPGSWIDANFNVWIGAPEDNRAWEYLSDARDFYDANASGAKADRRKLAFEELMIAEGSDWNWWYGPEHHSANDRDFDELYRKHLSNVYSALGAIPPEYLARPIAAGVAKPTLVPQSAYVRPRITGMGSSYFDWMGAAMYSSDRRTGSMHGKQFLLEAIYAGIDEEFLYGRLDFLANVRAEDWRITVHFAVNQNGSNGNGSNNGNQKRKLYCLEAEVQGGALSRWRLAEDGRRVTLASSVKPEGAQVALDRVFEFKLPLAAFGAVLGSNLNLRFTVFRGNVPLDALPLEGSLDVLVKPEDVLIENSYVNQ